MKRMIGIAWLVVMVVLLHFGIYRMCVDSHLAVIPTFVLLYVCIVVGWLSGVAIDAVTS